MTPVGFVTDVRGLLFGDAFLVQVRNSLGDPVILTEAWNRALPFFQLLPGRPIVDTAPQGGRGAGLGLAGVPGGQFEGGPLRVRGLQAGCRGVRRQPLGRGPGAAGRRALLLLLEPGRLIHDAHERGVARSVLGRAALRLAHRLVFGPRLWALALEAVGETAARRQAAGGTGHLDAAGGRPRGARAGEGSGVSPVAAAPGPAWAWRGGLRGPRGVRQQPLCAFDLAGQRAGRPALAVLQRDAAGARPLPEPPRARARGERARALRVRAPAAGGCGRDPPAGHGARGRVRGGALHPPARVPRASLPRAQVLAGLHDLRLPAGLQHQPRLRRHGLPRGLGGSGPVLGRGGPHLGLQPFLEVPDVRGRDSGVGPGSQGNGAVLRRRFLCSLRQGKGVTGPRGWGLLFVIRVRGRGGRWALLFLLLAPLELLALLLHAGQEPPDFLIAGAELHGLPQVRQRCRELPLGGREGTVTRQPAEQTHALNAAVPIPARPREKGAAEACTLTGRQDPCEPLGSAGLLIPSQSPLTQALLPLIPTGLGMRAGVSRWLSESSYLPSPLSPH